MATRVIEPDPDYGNTKLLKQAEIFPDVGSKFVGLYVKDEPNTRFEKNPQDYIFKLREGGLGRMTVNGELKDQLAKAKAHLGLVPGCKVTIEMTDLKPIPGMSARRVFLVGVDDAPKGAAPAATPKPKPVHNEDW